MLDVGRGLALRIEIEADFGVIDRVTSERGVVHLEADGAALGEVGARVGRPHLRFRADGVAADRRAAKAAAAGLSTRGRHARQVTGQHVVDALALGDLDGRGLQPAVFEVGGHGRPRILIVDDAVGRDRVGRNVQNHVRRAQRPLLGDEGLPGEGVGTLAARRAGFNPVDHCLDLVGRQAPVVGEVTNARISVIRRHALGPQGFADHQRMALDLLVVDQGHRTDAAGLVAGDALFLNDRCDVPDVGDLAVILLGVQQVDSRQPGGSS